MGSECRTNYCIAMLALRKRRGKFSSWYASVSTQKPSRQHMYESIFYRVGPIKAGADCSAPRSPWKGLCCCTRGGGWCGFNGSATLPSLAAGMTNCYHGRRKDQKKKEGKKRERKKKAKKASPPLSLCRRVGGGHKTQKKKDAS